ncbi:kinase [Aureococcus anophagefferens]|nr:kinase [Aureococcus anophagefferens]
MVVAMLELDGDGVTRRAILNKFLELLFNGVAAAGGFADLAACGDAFELRLPAAIHRASAASHAPPGLDPGRRRARDRVALGRRGAAFEAHSATSSSPTTRAPSRGRRGPRRRRAAPDAAAPCGSAPPADDGLHGAAPAPAPAAALGAPKLFPFCGDGVAMRCVEDIFSSNGLAANGDDAPPRPPAAEIALLQALWGGGLPADGG